VSVAAWQSQLSLGNAPGDGLEAQFVSCVRQNRKVMALLGRLPRFNLPQVALVAGALFQSVWNVQAGAPADAAIKDYDVFYFDAADLSAEGEASVNARLNHACADLGVTVEACNQARVHLWYESFFRHPYSALGSTDEGVARFLVRCTCVGLQPSDATPATLQLIAPYGLADLLAGRLARNLPFAPAELFERKVVSYQSRWPHLVVVPD
jgi:hypothetical protein